MHLRRAIVAVVSAIVAPPTARPAVQPTRAPSVDDLMKLRSIVDVQIAPDLMRVAYVVSTPNLAKNQHDAALFVVATAGGTPARLGETVRHGGPGGGFTLGLFPQFMHIVAQVAPYPTATLAGNSYAVLMPMPRGGAGYGEAGQRAIVNAWGEGDYQDIMAGSDALIAQGIADPNRLGVMGARRTAGAWKLYRTLKAIGKTVELEIYPRGGHVLREPMQQREQMRRNLEWFTKWIGTGS